MIPLLSPLHLFQSLTFRTGGAFLTAFLVSVATYPWFITWLRSFQKGASNIRQDVPDTHMKKVGTPTMGGLLILLTLLVTTLIWSQLNNLYVWLILAVTAAFGGVGFMDDLSKVRGGSKEQRNHSSGIPRKLRLLIESIIVLLAFIVGDHLFQDTFIVLPFIKQGLLNLGFFFFPFSLFVTVGAANAVNLTDGLDGLAIVPVMLATVGFAVIAYLLGNSISAHYLLFPYLPGVGEVTVMCGAVCGSGLGFLWFNAPPAKVFMGDTGALALGAFLGFLAVLTRNQLTFAIIGGLFVVEALSVIIQILVFKRTRRRVFAMAPIHHHFEKKGWPETAVVIRFWIVSVLLLLIGLSMLKIR